jgi:hypothetical protein
LLRRLVVNARRIDLQRIYDSPYEVARALISQGSGWLREDEGRQILMLMLRNSAHPHRSYRDLERKADGEGGQGP